ncbi:hypothetical protein GCM10010109_38290 [Actinoplanes campanulatus]|nr:hypothetical protein GCM10010109_38290 [Actinoplanes campanulatus]GID34688.1 hypothetical protein Aca09nite_11940 [Actinoplanes campanulatus]
MGRDIRLQDFCNNYANRPGPARMGRSGAKRKGVSQFGSIVTVTSPVPGTRSAFGTALRTIDVVAFSVSRTAM